MKRFYCTVCKRIKRVRKYPANVATPQNENPANRVGVCSYHVAARSGFTRNQIKSAQKVGA